MLLLSASWNYTGWLTGRQRNFSLPSEVAANEACENNPQMSFPVKAFLDPDTFAVSTLGTPESIQGL